MRNKKKTLTVLTIALSLPLSAIALTTLTNNGLAPSTKAAIAITYETTAYSGYRKLTSQYGIMENVEFVIAKGIQVMSKTHDMPDTNEYYIPADTTSTEGTRINIEDTSAIFSLKTGASSRYILNKKGTNSNLICVNETTDIKFGSQTSRHNAWEFNYVSNGEFTLHYQETGGNRDYLGYRNFTIAGTNYYGYRHVPNEESPATINVYVNVQSVIDAWANKYHLTSDYNTDGQCNTYFDGAKTALDSLGDMFKTCLAEEAGNADILSRYQAWAKARGVNI